MATECLQAAGGIPVALGIGHTAFHRIFGWEREFAKVPFLNSKVLTTIHVATTLFLLLCGLLTFRYAARP